MTAQASLDSTCLPNGSFCKFVLDFGPVDNNSDSGSARQTTVVKGDGAAAAGVAMAAPLFGPIFFFNQLVNKLLCWVKQ